MQEPSNNSKDLQRDDGIMGEVVPGLWIGSMAAVRLLPEKGGQWVVVSVMSSETLLNVVTDRLEQLKQLHPGLVLKHKIWKLKDENKADVFCADRLSAVLRVISESMTSPNQSCLVHCAKGVSRSAFVCAAWLMSMSSKQSPFSLSSLSLPPSPSSPSHISLQAPLSLGGALDIIRVARPQVNPNLGFVAALRAIEQSHGDITEAKRRSKRYLHKGEK